MEGESAEVAADCLRIPLVLREILEYFSTAELLELSLVNKQWSYEARRLLRDRDSLTARLTIDKSSLQKLRAFASDLRHMNVIPISGITVDLIGPCGQNVIKCIQPSKELNHVYNDILELLPWKHFSVRFLWPWYAYQNLPGFLFMMKVLEKFGSALEEFSLLLLSGRVGFIEEIFQDCSLARLKTLRLEDDGDYTSTEGYTALIKALVSRAPNLQALYTKGPVNLRGNLLEGSMAVHVTDYPFSPTLDKVPESVVGELRMQKMDLQSILPDFNMQSFHRIFPTLLQNSSSTLSKMHIDGAFLVPLALYRICLENVWSLSINLDPIQLESFQSCMQSLVKSFDFTGIFPNLRSVRIQWCTGSHEFLEFFELKNVIVREAFPDATVNIRDLRLDSDSPSDLLQDSSIRLFAEVFPTIQRLSVQAFEIPFSSVWDSWPDLREVDIAINYSPNGSQNFDSVFCGIFQEEVAQLREQDEEYLRSVNIVPVMPSITHLKGLKSLNFFYGDPQSSTEPVNDSTFLFSKVTALIAFGRCPALTVTLQVRDERLADELSHLKPYAAVVVEGYLDFDSDSDLASDSD